MRISFFLWMKGMHFEKLNQIFSAVLLACAVGFFIVSVLLSTGYLLELNGRITPCLVSYFWFCLDALRVSDCSFRGFWDSDLGALGTSVLLCTASDWGVGLSVLAVAECVWLKEKMKWNFEVWENSSLEN